MPSRGAMFDQFGMWSLPGSVVGAVNRVRSTRSVGSTVPTMFSIRRPRFSVSRSMVHVSCTYAETSR